MNDRDNNDEIEIEPGVSLVRAERTDDDLPIIDDVPTLELTASAKYIDSLIMNKTREQVLEYIDRQFQAIAMLSNEVALRALEKLAASEHDPIIQQRAQQLLRDMQDAAATALEARNKADRSTLEHVGAKLLPGNEEESPIKVTDDQWSDIFNNVFKAPASPSVTDPVNNKPN